MATTRNVNPNTTESNRTEPKSQTCIDEQMHKTKVAEKTFHYPIMKYTFHHFPHSELFGIESECEYFCLAIAVCKLLFHHRLQSPAACCHFICMLLQTAAAAAAAMAKKTVPINYTTWSISFQCTTNSAHAVSLNFSTNNL